MLMCIVSPCPASFLLLHMHEFIYLFISQDTQVLTHFPSLLV